MQPVKHFETLDLFDAGKHLLPKRKDLDTAGPAISALGVAPLHHF
ncbi:hypothetical protein ACFWXH_10245 [Mesorhizobium sp. NPDC059054]